MCETELHTTEPLIKDFSDAGMTHGLDTLFMQYPGYPHDFAHRRQPIHFKARAGYDGKVTVVINLESVAFEQLTRTQKEVLDRTCLAAMCFAGELMGQLRQDALGAYPEMHTFILCPHEGSVTPGRLTTSVKAPQLAQAVETIAARYRQQAPEQTR